MYDNEPRNPEIVKRMKKHIDNNDAIVIWSKCCEKDINDMISLWNEQVRDYEYYK